MSDRLSDEQNSVLKRAAETARQVFQLGVLPWISWWAASHLIADAPLVAPYLLVSPLIAFFVVGLVWKPKFADQFRRTSEPNERDLKRDPAIEALAGIYAEKAGIESVKVFFYESSRPYDNYAAQSVRGGLHVQPNRWEVLDEGEQQFVIARAIAEMHYSKLKRVWRPEVTMAVTMAMIVVGGIVACYSLWLILPMHVFAYGLFMGLMFRATRASILERDQQALVWTGDVESAIRYVEKHASQAHMFLSSTKRIAALREAARDLQDA